jgi:predicted nucleic acid-binding Zn ribbon protein
MIEDHKHCIVCGKPVPMDQLVCSPSCDEILKKHQKSAARARTIMLVIIFVMIILIAVSAILK